MHDSIQALGWGLLHSIWQLAALAALYAGLCALVAPRSARLRYGLGVAALTLACILPGSVVWRHAVAGSATTALRTHEHREIAGGTEGSGTKVVARKNAPVGISGVASLASSWRGRLEALLPSVVLVWLAGVALFTVRLASGVHGVGRLRRSGRPAPPEIVAAVRELAARLAITRGIAVSISAHIDVPMTFGIVRPVVLLPLALITALPLAQLELLVLHELAHLRRRDYLVNLLQCCVETLFFFHPAVWWLSARIREERERCCDDVVVAVSRDRTAYARALAELEAVRGDLPFTNAPALGARGSGLDRRIHRLLEPEPARRRHRVAAAGAALLLAVLVSAGGFALAQGAGGSPAPAAAGQTRGASEEPAAATRGSDVIFEVLVYDAPPGVAELLGIDWLSAGPGLGPASRSDDRASLDIGRVRDPTDLGWRLGAAERRGLIDRRTRHMRIATPLGEEAVTVAGFQRPGTPPEDIRLRMLPQLVGPGLMLHLGVQRQPDQTETPGELRSEVDLSLRDGDTLLVVAGGGAETRDAASELLLFLTVWQPPPMESPVRVPR